MKKKLSMMLLATSISIVGVTTQAQFVDLTSGKTVVLIKNNANGIMYNTETQRPVYIYINPSTNDTFYGRTGEIINGKVTRSTEGRYMYGGDTGYVYADGDFRVRRESDGLQKRFDSDGDVILKGNEFKKKTEIDGDIKIKDNGAKTKAEADGVLKVKDGDYRRKVDINGNDKIKDSTFKSKIESDGSIKVKDRNTNYKGKLDEDGDMKEKDPASKAKIKKSGKEKVKSEKGKYKATEDKTVIKRDE